MFSNKFTGFLAIVSVFALAACDYNSGATGTMSLNVTDAPVDNAEKVVVTFSGISLKPENGPAIDIDFFDENGDPVNHSIDLLAQQGAHSEPLLVDQVLPAGSYNWMRLDVVASQTTTDSYIELEGGGQHPLYVPSGDETGLKIVNNFDIPAGGAVTFTIDFDLRKSVVAPHINSIAYKLKPALRITNNDNVGHISGTAGTTTLNDAACTDTSYAVYVFAGEAVTPDDVDGIDPEPITTAQVSGTFEYAVGFLDAGIYTITFTCEADLDDNEADDTIDFIGTDTVTVNVGETTTYNFD